MRPAKALPPQKQRCKLTFRISGCANEFCSSFTLQRCHKMACASGATLSGLQ
jgi:hypothetical protein